MKKYNDLKMFAFVLTCSLLSLLLIAGCSYTQDVRKDGTVHDLEGVWTIVEFRGHTYVKWQGNGYYGGIAHNPDCICGNKE
jgi:hypothetical protein